MQCSKPSCSWEPISNTFLDANKKRGSHNATRIHEIWQTFAGPGARYQSAHTSYIYVYVTDTYIAIAVYSTFYPPTLTSSWGSTSTCYDYMYIFLFKYYTYIPHFRLRTLIALLNLLHLRPPWPVSPPNWKVYRPFQGVNLLRCHGSNRLRWSWDHLGWHRNSWFSGSQVEHGSLIFFGCVTSWWCLM